MTHSEYRQTLHWYNLKQQRTRIDSGLCVVCKKPTNELHHIFGGGYDFTQIAGQDVVLLCRECHKRFHNIWGYR